MRNPLRSEGEAYKFLWVTIAGAAAIVVASLIQKWAGVAVAVLVVLAVGRWIFQRDETAEPIVHTPVHQGAEDERRILVVANETVGGGPLQSCIRDKSYGYRGHVLVVAPALNSPLKHWVSDEDSARGAAQQRVDASVAKLREAGIDARGQVGDAEPLQAIEDALRTFGADEIIISTHPEGRSHWLEQGLVDNARRRFGVSITHVVVDLDAEREEVR